MAINKKLIHFKKYTDFIGSSGTNGVTSPSEGYYNNIPENSIVFILDTLQIWTHGRFYDGKTFDPTNIEQSIQNILDNYATKSEIPTKISDLNNDLNYLTSADTTDEVEEPENNSGNSSGGSTTVITSGGVSVIYVNAVSGSDTNTGKKGSPKKTFQAAIDAGGDDLVIMFEGDTTEKLNIKQKSSLSRLKVIGAGGKRNRILGGTKLTSFTLYATGIYLANVTNSNLSNANYKIYQHDINNTTTEISNAEKHPSLKGRRYRMLSMKLTKVSSLSDLSSASNYSYYYTSGKLYVKTTNTNFTTNPIMLPSDQGWIYGNDGSCSVEFYNVEVWYAPFIINNSHGAKLIDCAAKFALGTGGIRYDDCLGILFIRCEACATNNLSGYGDGINGHSYLDNSLNANTNRHLYVSAEMIDCWCHDNDDDGWSDHTGCKSTLRGGLYEYNKKGGVTPSGGAPCECYNVLSRNNYRGFYYISSSSTTKEPYGEFYVQNCVSKNNSIAGYDALSNNSSLTVICHLVDCISINDKIAYKADTYSHMYMIDCSAVGAGTIKQCSSSGSLTITNTTIIT